MRKTRPACQIMNGTHAEARVYRLYRISRKSPACLDMAIRGHVRQHGCASYLLLGATFSFSDGRSRCRRKIFPSKLVCRRFPILVPSASRVPMADLNIFFASRTFLVFTHEARPPFLSQYPPPSSPINLSELS